MLDRSWVPHTYLERQRRWVAIRRLLVREQDGLCAICGQPMREGDRNIDHVWPSGAGDGAVADALNNHPNYT